MHWRFKKFGVQGSYLAMWKYNIRYEKITVDSLHRSVYQAFLSVYHKSSKGSVRLFLRQWLSICQRCVLRTIRLSGASDLSDPGLDVYKTGNTDSAKIYEEAYSKILKILVRQCTISFDYTFTIKQPHHVVGIIVRKIFFHKKKKKNVWGNNWNTISMLNA